jgi:hypothetical protein
MKTPSLDALQAEAKMLEQRVAAIQAAQPDINPHVGHVYPARRVVCPHSCPFVDPTKLITPSLLLHR